MRAAYGHRGNDVIFAWPDGKVIIVAHCPQAEGAAAMLAKARRLNDALKHKAAARLIAQVETIPGFEWVQS